MHAGRGYFTFADMVVFKATQVSVLDGLPSFALLLHSRVFFLDHQLVSLDSHLVLSILLTFSKTHGSVAV